ncbi:CXXC-type zinc finger protein 1-like [Sinocyclocheilus anshuiensis]|uniref:CXXC-type zinc finger protein 1-like n=1 Tax=Sinocyclocheilus anshuiensis TaxID=1608454 RepID=UPI0007B97A0C|nr:PREDICTED: CXXC-type zinc finger protein 1-like [Sinocyclocheilus anshuiensis]
MDSEMSDIDETPAMDRAVVDAENTPLYCICRKPDINCFMIGCDNCNEWFHGHCINVTEKMAKAIREWYCQQCQELDPSLSIRYRKKNRDKDVEPERVEKRSSTPEYKIDKRRGSKVSVSQVYHPNMKINNNPQSKTYCKRLQVLCPEHSRDPKVPADEVCGCPLVCNVFEPTGEYCRVSKRKCNKHYCWEKLRRAEVDLERVRVWYKLDELFEQERNVRTAMTNRAGLLALMLHQTIQHDPLTTDLRSNKDR